MCNNTTKYMFNKYRIPGCSLLLRGVLEVLHPGKMATSQPVRSPNAHGLTREASELSAHGAN